MRKILFVLVIALAFSAEFKAAPELLQSYENFKTALKELSEKLGDSFDWNSLLQLVVSFGKEYAQKWCESLSNTLLQQGCKLLLDLVLNYLGYN